MKTITRIATAIAISFASLSFTTLSHAGDDHSQSATDLPVVIGEVKKISSKSGKITIKHEPIPNLDMPGMTMVFRTNEGTDLSELKKGDNVEFTVIDKDGKMVIVTIKKSE